MTYVWLTQFTDQEGEEFIKKIATVTDYFIELISTQYGLFGTTNPRTVRIIFDNRDNCSGVVYEYPASKLC